MMWLLWGFVASVAAITLEVMYRLRIFSSYWSGLWLLLPLGMLIQLGLFHSYRDAPRYLTAWAAFFTVNVIGRIVVSFVIHEPVSPGSIVGVFLIIAGAFATRM